MKIFLDIETIPAGPEPVQEKAPPFTCLVPKNYKDPVKIAKYIEENRDMQLIAHLNEYAKKYLDAMEEFRKGALKATRSQIVCICATSDSFDFKECMEDEHLLLARFSVWLNTVCLRSPSGWVGHNIAFDLQILRTHAAKFKVFNLKECLTFDKWPKNIHDTMELWAGVRKDDRTKLTEIAEFLGIKNLNGDTDGSDIYGLYKAGKFEEIQTKCFNDVLMCKQVYERIS